MVRYYLSPRFGGSVVIDGDFFLAEDLAGALAQAWEKWPLADAIAHVDYDAEGSSPRIRLIWRHDS